MSYRKTHIKSRINRIRPKKNIFKRGWFWLLILLLILVSAGFYFFLFFPGVQVRNIVVLGNHKVSADDVKNLVDRDINNNLSKSIFLVNSDRIEKKILNNFLAIQSIKVDKSFFHTLDVKIVEKASVAVFCQMPSGSTEKENCYSMDNNGIIFEPLSILPKNIIIVRQITSGPNIFAGEKVVAQNIMDLILKVEKSLKDNFQINVKEAMVKSLIRLDINTNENWKIYFNTGNGSNIDLQLTKLNLLLSKEISANQRKNLRYINLIPSGKAVICDNSTCGE